MANKSNEIEMKWSLIVEYFFENPIWVLWLLHIIFNSNSNLARIICITFFISQSYQIQSYLSADCNGYQYKYEYFVHFLHDFSNNLNYCSWKSKKHSWEWSSKDETWELHTFRNPKLKNFLRPFSTSVLINLQSTQIEL